MPLTDKQKEYFKNLQERNNLRDERLLKTRLTSHISSVASDSKWLKIFESLENSVRRNTLFTIKFLRQPEPWEYSHLAGSVFEKTYFDGASGPVSYSEIEWIEFESESFPEFDFQVDVEYVENKLRIYGYRNAGS